MSSDAVHCRCGAEISTIDGARNAICPVCGAQLEAVESPVIDSSSLSPDLEQLEQQQELADDGNHVYSAELAEPLPRGFDAPPAQPRRAGGGMIGILAALLVVVLLATGLGVVGWYVLKSVGQAVVADADGNSAQSQADVARDAAEQADRLRTVQLSPDGFSAAFADQPQQVDSSLGGRILKLHQVDHEDSYCAIGYCEVGRFGAVQASMSNVTDMMAERFPKGRVEKIKEFTVNGHQGQEIYFRSDQRKNQKTAAVRYVRVNERLYVAVWQSDNTPVMRGRRDRFFASIKIDADAPPPKPDVQFIEPQTEIVP